MQQVRSVIFDCDDTLARSEELRLPVAWRDALRALNLTPEERPLEPFARRYRGTAFSAILRQEDRAGILSEEDIARLDREYQRRLLDTLQLTPPKPTEGALYTMRHLREAGFTLAVCSSSTQEKLDKVVHAIGADIYLPREHHFSWEANGVRLPPKPSPEIYENAIDHLERHDGINPESCLRVEDSKGGIQAALAARAGEQTCIAYLGTTPQEERSVVAQVYVEQLGVLAAIEHLREVLDVIGLINAGNLSKVRERFGSGKW